MLSLFPDLLSLALVAPLLLRLTIGFFLMHEGWALLFERSQSEENPVFWFRVIGVVQFAVGVLLFIGLYTQPATLAAMILSVALVSSTKTPLAPRERLVYSLVFMISLSLLFLGPGILGFDLPL